MSALLRTFLMEDARRLLAGAEARVFLAAFGKHPGWDDHIEDLGLDTESLVVAKQILYVRGIGGQIDAGAWDQLAEDEQLPEFHNTLLWWRSGQGLVSRIWSSSDGKGRTRYPMIVCAHCLGVPLEQAIPRCLPILSALQQECVNARSASTVRSLISRYREELQQAANPRTPLAALPLSGREFLERVGLDETQPGGWPRLVYQMGNQFSGFATGRVTPRQLQSELRPQQIRVPALPEDPANTFAFWGRLLLSQTDERIPALLEQPEGKPWVDITLGEPGSHEFFALRASPKAMALASDVPYKLTPEQTEFAANLRKVILSGQGTIPSLFPARAADAAPSKGSTTEARSSTFRDETPEPAPRRGSKALLIGLIAGVLLLGVVGVLVAKLRNLGGFRFESDPPGAALFLTGSEGPIPLPGTNTPLRLERLPAGAYTLSVMATGYEAYVTNFSVTGHERSWRLVAPLERTSGYLLVKTIPAEGVTVRWRGAPGDAVALQRPLRLPVGRYELLAEYPQWEPKPQTVEVRREETSEVLFVFSANTLAVRVDPWADLVRLRPRAAGGRVAEQTNRSALAFEALAPGDYDLEVVNRWFEPHQQPVRVVEGQATRPVEVRLQPGKGRLRLTSNVSGVQFFLTRRNGQTLPPQQLNPESEVLAGTNVIEARLGDWQSSTTNVVERGAALALAIPLPVGAVAVTTEPREATVVLQGGRFSRTNEGSPALFGDLQPEVTYTVTASAPGFALERKTVKAQAGQTNAVPFQLQKAEAALLVTSDPPGAKVLINGREQGTTASNAPLRIAVSPGRTTVTGQYAGLEDVTTNLDLALNMNAPVRLAFAYAELTLGSQPQPAAILLAWTNNYGPTPHTFVLRPGTYRWSLTNTLGTNSTTTTLAAGQKANVVVLVDRIIRTNNPFGMEFVKVDDLWVGRFEVTEGEYARVMGLGAPANPNLPKAGLEWANVMALLDALNARDTNRLWAGGAAFAYAMPTEAEWWAFAREATNSTWYANPTNAVTSVGASRSGPAEVQKTVPNSLGIHGLAGNVAEWCAAPAQGARGPRMGLGFKSSTSRAVVWRDDSPGAPPDAGLRVVVRRKP